MKKLTSILALLFICATAHAAQLMDSFVDDLEVNSSGVIQFEGATDDDIVLKLAVVDPTSSNKTATFPDATGTVALLSTANVFTADNDFGGAGIEIENNTAIPGSCTVGQLFLDTDGTTGEQLYACEGGSFVAQAGGGGSSEWTDAGAYLHPNTDGDGIRIRNSGNTTYFEILDSGGSGYNVTVTDNVNILSTTGHVLLDPVNSIKTSNDNLDFYGSTNAIVMSFDLDDGADEFRIGLDDDGGNMAIFTNDTNTSQDHDHATTTDPTVFIHSDTAPDTANDEWISLSHDKTDAQIAAGSGDITIGNYPFNTDETVGAGQDNYVLTYDDGAGKIGLEVAAGGGTGAFSDASDPVVLNTTTKDVVIGAAQKNTSKFTVDNEADQVAATIQGHSTQTSPLLVVEASDGTDYLNLDINGLTITTDNGSTDFNLTDSTNNALFIVNVGQAGDTPGLYLNEAGTNRAIFQYATTSNTFQVLNQETDGDIIFRVKDGGVNNTVLKIDGALGFVGIGDAVNSGTIDGLLHLDAGTVDTILYLEKDAGTAAKILFDKSGVAEVEISYTSAEELEINNMRLDEDITFSVNDGGATVEIMTLNASESRVGIGDTSPDGLLDVGDGTNDTIITTTSFSFTGTAKPWKVATIDIKAFECKPTNGCSIVAKQETGTHDYVWTPKAFDEDADDISQIDWQSPNIWDAGPVRFQYIWAVDPTDTVSGGGVSFFLSGASYADGDPIGETAHGTAIEVNDDFQVLGDFHFSPVSGDVTISGSPTAGDMLVFDLYRDISDSDDDLTGGSSNQAWLKAVRIFYQIDKLSNI